MPLSGWSHDIRDPEAFVGRIVERSRRKLDSHQRERLHQFLLIELWQLSLNYHAGGILFSTWAGNTLPRRIIDWERTPEEGGRVLWTKPRTGGGKQYAESYERERPKFYTLVLEDHAPDSPLGTPHSERLVDATPDRSPDLMRVLRAGSSSTTRRDDTLGSRSPRRAA